MQWTTEDLLFRLPSNAVIRQVIDGKAAMPDRGALRHVYENQVERISYKRQQDKKKQQLASAPATPNDMSGAMAANPPAMDPAQSSAKQSQPQSMNASGSIDTLMSGHPRPQYLESGMHRGRGFLSVPSALWLYTSNPLQTGAGRRRGLRHRPNREAAEHRRLNAPEKRVARLSPIHTTRSGHDPTGTLVSDVRLAHRI
jgi:hypothetical protein